MANIIVCADGTWNRPEKTPGKDHPTNVLKLARAIQPDSNGQKQHVFYDWGIGSYHNSFSAGLTGSGLNKNILDCYRYIVQNYTPGDHIYLFGFSRGAYTVRAVSGLINNCGIVKRDHARLISEAWKIYKKPGKACHPKGTKAIKFRQDYAHDSRAVHFIGVWDTVGALGIPFSIMGLFTPQDEFYDTKIGSNVAIARHALAIDEQRVDFEPTIWATRPTLDLKQVWFSGVHSDVGGSYGPDKKTGAEVADTPLSWMLNEAFKAGLVLEPHINGSLTDGRRAPLHKSRNHVYRLKPKLHRPLEIQEKNLALHSSVRERYESDEKYRPVKLVEWVSRRGWEGIPIEPPV